MRKILVTLLVVATSVLAFAQQTKVLTSNTIFTLPDGQSVYCLKGTIVTTDAQGNVIGFVPVSPVTLKTPQGQEVEIKAGTEVELFSDGTLKSFTPTKNITLSTPSGEQVMVTSNQKVKLHKNGALKSGTIFSSREVVAGDNRKFSIIAKTPIEFDSQGKVISAFPLTNLTFEVNGTQVECLGRKKVEFYPDGKLASCVIAKPVTLVDANGQQVTLDEGRKIKLDKDGKVISIR